MKKYQKKYLGKGIKVENMDIVRITLKMEDVMLNKYNYEGRDFITFELAQLQQPDKFGRTHTAYVSTQEEVEALVKELNDNPDAYHDMLIKVGRVPESVQGAFSMPPFPAARR